MKISLLVPTRQRPDGLLRFGGSAYVNACVPDDVEVVVYIDDDDATYDEILSAPNADAVLTILRGPRITLSEMWNRCADVATGEVLGHMGDDIIFRTYGWDDMVRDAFMMYDDRIAFVHGRDGIQDGGLGTHGFLHRRWVETIGYFVPPYFSSDYNDTWLTEVADMIGRRVYLPDLYTEHMHHTVGKAEMDQNTIDRLRRHREDDVDRLYRSLQNERQRDAAKLREVLQ